MTECVVFSFSLFFKKGCRFMSSFHVVDQITMKVIQELFTVVLTQLSPSNAVLECVCESIVCPGSYWGKKGLSFVSTGHLCFISVSYLAALSTFQLEKPFIKHPEYKCGEGKSFILVDLLGYLLCVPHYTQYIRYLFWWSNQYLY